MLEEQQLLIQKSEDMKLQNDMLESTIMKTAARIRKMIDSADRKDRIIGQLEQDIQTLQRENKLQQVQLDNHNEKEKMMSENLTHFMDENIRLKNKDKVPSLLADDAELEDSENRDTPVIADEVKKLKNEIQRFKHYVNETFIKKDVKENKQTHVPLHPVPHKPQPRPRNQLKQVRPTPRPRQLQPQQKSGERSSFLVPFDFFSSKSKTPCSWSEIVQSKSSEFNNGNM